MSWRSLTIGFLTCLCAYPTLSSPDTLTQDNAIPVRIAEYYKAGNFVVAFSTADEREQLAVSYPDTTSYSYAGRLGEVQKKLQILISCEMQYDNEFADEAPGLPYLANQFSVPFKVVHQEGNRLILLVQTYELPYQAPLSFISTYETGIEPEASLRPALRAYTEVHEWVQKRGQWLRRPDAIRMLSTSPIPVDAQQDI